MKEKDVIIDCPEQQVILYVEKEDGKYEPMQTGSYITKNYLDDYEMKRHHLEESLKKQVLSARSVPSITNGTGRFYSQRTLPCRDPEAR